MDERAQVEQLRELFKGAIECDETTFGGARQGKRGWGAAGKVIVFGLIKRNGCVKAMPIPAHDRASVMRQIQAHAREGPCTTPLNGRRMPHSSCAVSI
ncbi:MAG: hypothetical protein Q4A28_07920 [Brachymonas sp.]|nr:hypothetical protein [Brachymonas sp.]